MSMLLTLYVGNAAGEMVAAHGVQVSDAETIGDALRAGIPALALWAREKHPVETTASDTETTT